MFFGGSNPLELLISGGGAKIMTGLGVKNSVSVLHTNWKVIHLCHKLTISAVEKCSVTVNSNAIHHTNFFF